MRLKVISIAFAAWAGLTPHQPLAQTTTVYGYDTHGRLTSSGTNNYDTQSYKLG